MPRPRAFDDTAALDACVDQFWDRGYHATSTDDLCARAGLSRSSLYNAFGKKREVYLRGVGHYSEQRVADRAASLERSAAATGRDALRVLLTDLLDVQWRDAGRRVCFGIHATVDVDVEDTELREVLLGNADQLREVLAGLIARGQQDGSLRSGLDPAALAAVVHVAYDGLQVAARLRPDRAETEATVDTLLELL
jgi:TetR/AcrR family transcriptional regulator, transcriptional repressor for nem operon